MLRCMQDLVFIMAINSNLNNTINSLKIFDVDEQYRTAPKNKCLLIMKLHGNGHKA